MRELSIETKARSRRYDEMTQVYEELIKFGNKSLASRLYGAYQVHDHVNEYLEPARNWIKSKKSGQSF